MKPRITLITLGVDDVERAVRFYRDGLGLQTAGLVGTEFAYGAVAFFDLQAGLKLALWSRASIAHDTGLPPGSPGSTECTMGHNVSSKVEVDEVMAQARRAGAVVVKPAQDTFWGGYAGYFQDPDGHLWEVAWNPQWVIQIHDGVAELGSTSTRSQFRGRGVQSALLDRRLAVAYESGCDLALVITIPGTASQRNVERIGFRLAYTKPVLIGHAS